MTPQPHDMDVNFDQIQNSSRDGYPIVLVDWIDSCENADNSDVGIYDLPSPQRLFYAGFIIHEEEDYIVIAGGIKPAQETYDYTMAIPRCAINSMRYLNPVNTEEEG